MSEEENIFEFLKRIEVIKGEIKVIQNKVNNELARYMVRLAQESNMDKLLEVFQSDFSINRSKESLLAKSIIEGLGWAKGHGIVLKIILCSVPELCSCAQCKKDIKNMILHDDISSDDIKYFSERGLRITSQYRVKVPSAWTIPLYCCRECQENHHKAKEEKRKENEERRLLWLKSRVEDARPENINNETLEHLKSMPYKDYLQTEHWKKLRGSALKKAGYRCQLCNRNNMPLQTHHRTYERRGEEWLSDLIVLCEDCHKKHHNIREEF